MYDFSSSLYDLFTLFIAILDRVHRKGRTAVRPYSLCISLKTDITYYLARQKNC